MNALDALLVALFIVARSFDPPPPPPPPATPVLSRDVIMGALSALSIKSTRARFDAEG